MPQPVEYTYEETYGDRTAMTTYRSGDGSNTWTGSSWPQSPPTGDTTNWSYHAATGLLETKTDADSQAVTYTYTADGRLKTRTWARGVTTTYTHWGEGQGEPMTAELKEISYDDGTPTASFTYKRTGQFDTITDAAGTREFTYDDGLQPTDETLDGSGVLPAMTVTRQYETQSIPLGRFKGLAVDSSYSYQASYFYDATGRLSRVTGPGLPSTGSVYGAYYSYVTHTDLLSQTLIKNNNATRLQTDRVYEQHRDLLDYVQNAWTTGTPTTISKYDYTNDTRGRRTGIAYTGLAFNSPNPAITQTLTYNDRNELIESTRSDSSLLRRTYTYDPIGNRTESRDRTAPSELVTAYQRNELNQYPRADTTGPATNLGQGYRFDDDGDMLEAYVAADMNCDGTINAFDVDAFTLALTATPPDYPEYYSVYPTCDRLNGDMNADGVLDAFDIDLFTEYLTGHSGATGLRQVYTWDAENRLITAGPADDMTLVNGTKRAEYAYDYMSRRIEKKVYTWQTTPPPAHWTLTEHRRFVWAGTGMGGVGVSPAGGWLMLMELDGLNHNAVVRKYTWGLDLAGQNGGQTSGLSGLEGAGGIGGLLAVEQPQGGGSSLNYVYFYDGNGNVGQVIKPLETTAAASIKVKYEYDPYGTRTNPQQIGEFDQPFRFSTKYFDAETGLYYFGYRYYHPKLGRWISRDPLGLDGGSDLYQYAMNDPLTDHDALGLITGCSYSPLDKPSLSRRDVRVCSKQTILLPIGGGGIGRAEVLVCDTSWNPGDKGVRGMACECRWSVHQLCNEICCKASYWTGGYTFVERVVVVECDRFSIPPTYGTFFSNPADPLRGFDCQCPEPSFTPTTCCGRGNVL